MSFSTLTHTQNLVLGTVLLLFGVLLIIWPNLMNGVMWLRGVWGKIQQWWQQAGRDLGFEDDMYSLSYQDPKIFYHGSRDYVMRISDIQFVSFVKGFSKHWKENMEFRQDKFIQSTAGHIIERFLTNNTIELWNLLEINKPKDK